MRAFHANGMKILGAVLALAAATLADAQHFPTKPVRIITAGVGTFHDLVTRHLGQRLGEHWGQPVVVENQPAAGLTIGTSIAARATPDGYTLVMADRTSLAVAPSLYRNLAYDPLKDLSPITLVALAPQMLVVHPSVPATNLSEFIEYARQRPGALNYAGAGAGTAIHMTGELFKYLAGVDLVAVQYKGGGPALMAVLSGEVHATFLSIPAVLPHVASGKVRPLVIASRKRVDAAPNVPIAAEAGLPGLESAQWIGLLAPARTPRERIAILNKRVIETIQEPAIQEMLRTQGAEPAAGTPADFAAFIQSETVKLRKVIEVAGIRAD